MVALIEEILQCTKCNLYKTRHNVIFGEGNFYAGILIIGEAPGRDEDLWGRPFVGRSAERVSFISLKNLSVLLKLI